MNKESLLYILAVKAYKEARKPYKLLRRFLYYITKYKLTQFLVRIFLRWKYRIFNFISIEGAKIKFPDRIEVLSFFSNELSYSEPIYKGTGITENKIVHVEGLNNYSLRIKDAIVTGCSNLIEISNSLGIYELKYRDQDNNISYTDESFFYFTDNYCIKKNLGSISSIPEGIWLTGNYSINYYHLMIEYIVKFKVINDLNLDVKIPLIIDESLFTIPQYKEIIEIFNFNKRDYVLIPKGKLLQVANLYYFSSLNHIPPNIKDENKLKNEFVLLQLDTITFLRENLLPHKTKSNFPNRVYISRENASGRRKFNEVEVFNTLTEFGFVKVFPEKMSINDQVALFNNAEFIVGGAGAAFTNLVFCKKGCKVIALTSYKIPITIFSTIASSLDVSLIYITDPKLDQENENTLHDDYTINTDMLVEQLNQMGISQVLHYPA